ncbi:MAG: type I-E CRISPR-associated protein Cse2/CasB [Clostridiales bacterium]|nr:type I-E CRISPR-associated protein Cse2/CasB [Clostridiales bacterium]
MVNEGTQASTFVRQKIERLLNSKNESATRATLANLRRGLGKPPGSMPELWADTLEGLPNTLAGTTGGPTRGEWAVHTALTLFALHQQGKDPRRKPMSRAGESLGMSLRRLVKSEDDLARVKRRFDAAATAHSPEEFSHHLRGLVQLLKAEDIPLDYPALAEDLYWFQFPQARDNLRLHWGRDFYHVAARDTQDPDNTDEGKDDTDENQ